MRNEQDYEQERENAIWKMSIKRMFQSGDLEGLVDLKEGPESLDDEIVELLDSCIQKIKSGRNERSQAE